MNIKKLILAFALVFISAYSFGQVDRKSAKFMDTCAFAVVSSETIVKNLPVDSTNRFMVNCNCNLLEFRLSIYDRWGNVALKLYDIKDKISFSDFKRGVYFWVVEVKYPTGKLDNKKGTVKIE